MIPRLQGTDALLEELRILDLLTPDDLEHIASRSVKDEDARACANRLVEMGLLSSFQIGKVLAGQGRRLRVGPYLLLEPLSGGGTGRVYRAEHRLMKRIVALKRIRRPRGGREDESVLERFRREAAAAGRVRHPSIVTVFDAGTSRGWLYLAMEYLQGIDLQRAVERDGPLSVDLACDIVRQTASALHHAHNCGLVHRDVKPSNLFLTAPGTTVKLLDFGLIRWIGQSETEDGALCGTPNFMAPEWSNPSERLDPRGDLYALGCTFYYLLTGQVPYPGGSWTEKLLRHRLDQPTPLVQIRPRIPEQVADVVERLMAREVECRYNDALEVVEALTFLRVNALESPIRATPERLAPPSTAPPRRKMQFSLVALAVVLLGAAAGSGARWTIAPRDEPTTPIQQTIEFPFAIERKAEIFPTLSQAIAAADDGDTIVMGSVGPFATPPLNWTGKALTLRAAEGTRPRLELQPTENPWLALLQTDRDLILEGIELAYAAAPIARQSRSAAPLIRSHQASLTLRNCRVIGNRYAAAIVVRNPREVVLRKCQVDAGTVAMSVEAGQRDSLRLALEDTRFTMRDAEGAALSLWSAEVCEETSLELKLHGNTFECGCFAALRNLPSAPTIEAHSNRFNCRNALLRYSGNGERAVWRGVGNSYRGRAMTAPGN